MSKIQKNDDVRKEILYDVWDSCCACYKLKRNLYLLKHAEHAETFLVCFNCIDGHNDQVEGLFYVENK